MKLRGKTAIVTGGARGIGNAIARRFLEEGASVFIADRSLSETSDSSLPQDRVAWMEVDIADLDSHERLVDAALARFRRLDILVNNAGIQIREPFLEAHAENWDRILGVNLKGPYFLAQRAARAMADSGSIVNVSSIHDSRPALGNSIYSITKGGVRMMTRCMALELAEHGIRVNAISPGAIATDINRDVLSDASFHNNLELRIPLSRIGVECAT